MHASRFLRRTRHVLVATAFAATVAGVSSVSSAADPAAAQSLFDDAKRLMKAGRYTEACPKLEESGRLDPGMGTLFQLADCYEHVGRTASAWAAFVELAGRAKAAAQPAREKAARDRANLLEPKLPRLMIRVQMSGPDAIAGLAITRDGEPVGSAQWGTAVPVDPGEHRIAVSAPGYKSWLSTASLRGDGKTVIVVVPRLEAEAIAPPPAPPVPVPQPVASEARPAPPPPAPVVAVDTSRGSAQRTTGGVLIGFGLAGLATGGAFALASRTTYGASSPHCNGNLCDATGVQRRDEARTYGDVATIALGAGAAVFIGGVITYVTAPSSTSHAVPTTSRRAQVAPMIGPGVTGVSLGGRF